MQDDALAEQGEAGASVHLAFDCLDLVHGAFDFAGAVGQGEAVGDGLLIVADAGGEGAQAGVVVGFHGGEPAFQVAVAGSAGHHLGEAGDVPGEGADVGTAVFDGFELGLFFWPEVVGAGKQPAGDLPGFRYRGGRVGRGACLPERGYVAADGLDAAGPAAFLQLSVQGGGVGNAFVPPLADVRLERVELRFPAGGLARSSSMVAARAKRCTVLRSRPRARQMALSDCPSLRSW